jgi:MT-A70
MIADKQDFKYHDLANLFPLLDGDEFAALAADVGVNGLHEPIKIYEGAILDGRNRYRACVLAGVDAQFETYDGEDPLGYVLSLNLKRRHLDEGQRAMVAAKIANIPFGGNQYEGSPIGEPISQRQAANLLNVGKRSVERAREVIDRGVPELVAAVEQGRLSVSVAALATRQPESRQREAAAAAELGKENSARQIITQGAALDRTSKVEFRAKELGKFSVIYADPPWRYEAPEIGGPSRRIENHYPTMELQEICDLPIAEIAHKDSVLFLWTTAPKLAESMRVINAWGFSYRTGMVWTKNKIGCGFWVRNQHDLAPKKRPPRLTV